MKRLTKSQATELETLRTALGDAGCLFNQARSALESFREDIVSQQEEYLSERSEGWTESEAGEAYAAWAGEWQEECADESTEDAHEYPTEVNG